MELEMRPWNATVFLPLWPVKYKLPAVKGRWQTGLRRFFLVCARHLPLTSWPLTRWVKLKLITAGTLSEKENVVPTWTFFLALIRASFLPKRQVERDWWTELILGGTRETGRARMLDEPPPPARVDGGLVYAYATPCSSLAPTMCFGAPAVMVLPETATE